MAGTRVGFLQEDNGNRSEMRLMCLIALLAAVLFGIMTLLRQGSAGDGLYLTGLFLLAAFAPKAVQKMAEQKVPMDQGASHE